MFGYGYNTNFVSFACHYFCKRPTKIKTENAHTFRDPSPYPNSNSEKYCPLKAKVDYSKFHLSSVAVIKQILYLSRATIFAKDPLKSRHKMPILSGIPLHTQTQILRNTVLSKPKLTIVNFTYIRLRL